MKKEIKRIIKILNKVKKALSLPFKDIIIIGVFVLLMIVIVLVIAYVQFIIPRQEQAEIKKALEEAKQEIESLKERQVEQESKPPQIITKETIKETPAPAHQSQEISASEIEPYLMAVVQISCEGGFGSGFLWKFKGNNYSVITNKHVVEFPYTRMAQQDVVPYCRATAKALNGDGWALILMYPYLHPSLNSGTDVYSSRLETAGIMRPLEELNYKLTSLRKCSVDMSVGLPVMIIGYPAFAVSPSADGMGIFRRIITEGIISGHKEEVINGKRAHHNYYVSAKIDSGNSGGVAISKDESGLCLLGVPTWLTVGNWETQGIVQNIHNVISKE